jgi:hypothetical protein
MPPPLLCIRGGDDPARAVRVGNRIHWRGTTDLVKLLGGAVPHHTLHIAGSVPPDSRNLDLSRYWCVINLITEPEGSQRSLQALRTLLRGYRGRLFNRPQAVASTTREGVARLLAGVDGLVVPRVVRLPAGKPIDAAELGDALGWPLILRRAGTHTGKSLELARGAGDLSTASAPDCDQLATEFIDFRSADGLYRKYRVHFFGTRRVFRHLYVSDGWNIHSGVQLAFMVHRPELLEEARMMYERPEGCFPPQVEAVLQHIRVRMPLDFFGVDFGVLPDGRVVLFEANAAMRFLRIPTDPRLDFVRRCVAPAQAAFARMLGFEVAGAGVDTVMRG